MLRWISVGVTCSVFAFACGDDDDDTIADAGDTTAPEVVSTTPVDGATEVASDSSITVSFSEEIDPSTLNESSFTVEDPQGTSLSGTVVADGTVGTLTLDDALYDDMTYTAKVTAAVTDLTGNSLAAEVSWSFATHARAWDASQLVENEDGEVGGADVAIGPTGRTFVVWNQWQSPNWNVWAKRYTAGIGWVGAGTLLDYNAFYPQVGVDSTGNAVTVWETGDGTTHVRATRYVYGTGWEDDELLETDTEQSAGRAVVGVDPAGNAVVVWQQSDSNWANQYVVGTGWGTAELLETDDVGTAEWPKVAVDATGNAIAVWMHGDGARTNIWANRYELGTGWGTAELIEADDAGDAMAPEVAVDAAGNAIAVWMQEDGTRRNIWANRYVVDSGWGTAELVETDDAGHAQMPQVAMDAAGNAVAVWMQDDSRRGIRANRYVVGSGWGTAELIEADDTGDAEWPEVAVDAAGSAIAVWMHSIGGRTDIWANRYAVGTGWGTAALIETDDAGDAEYPKVGVDAVGNALAVWSQSDGTRMNIWASGYQ